MYPHMLGYSSAWAFIPSILGYPKIWGHNLLRSNTKPQYQYSGNNINISNSTTTGIITGSISISGNNNPSNNNKDIIKNNNTINSTTNSTNVTQYTQKSRNKCNFDNK